MEASTFKQNSWSDNPGETRIVANREEAVVGVPVVVPPVEVEVTLRTVPVEIRHVAVAIDLANGALCEKPPMPLPPDCFAEAVSNS